MVNSKRLARLRTVLQEQGLKNALLSSTNDVFYYTGYRSASRAFLLVNPRPRLFISPLENAAEKLPGVGVVWLDKPDKLSRALKGLRSVGYDESDLPAGVLAKLPRKGLKPAARHLKTPRMVKDKGELALIRRACTLTRRMFGGLDVKGTEWQVAQHIKSVFLGHGAGSAFPPIVTSGPNSWHIHQFPTNRLIRPQDLVIVDAGARVGGYCSDCTRTFCQRPGTRERGLIESVTAIQKEVLDRMAPGADPKELQKQFESLMRRAGHKVWHSIGHGVGLSPHDFLEGKLEPGMVLTVEPGTYIKGFGGCRIEDTVLIKKGGREVLT